MMRAQHQETSFADKFQILPWQWTGEDNGVFPLAPIGATPGFKKQTGKSK